MEQKEIREWGGTPYSNEEGAAIIKELDDRTKSSSQGYNSIDELAGRVQTLEAAAGVGLTAYGYRVEKGAGNSAGQLEEGDDLVGAGNFYVGFWNRLYVHTLPMDEQNPENSVTIINSKEI